ncbi:MAG: hypothetical protein DMG36_20985 [Acidobacteria bacterium]|nr:MAG: hypothetical protein DMG36_20985 [Acidobacteriota bacterium]
MLDALSGLISTQQNKPLSIVVAVLALFAPGALIIFLARPELFASVGITGVILLSICISLPIVMICYGIWWTPLSAIHKILLALRGEMPETDFLRLVTKADPLEWPCLLAATWSSSVIMFGIAVVAYYVPIRIGATFLLTASILLGTYLIVLILTVALDTWARRKLKQRLEELVRALTQAAQTASGPTGAA